ncbi:MAG: hypothetical protein AVDCRST_MAG36-567, partial [uncultured Nocardioidaceae bacterium]
EPSHRTGHRGRPGRDEDRGRAGGPRPGFGDRQANRWHAGDPGRAGRVGRVRGAGPACRRGSRPHPSARGHRDLRAGRPARTSHQRRHRRLARPRRHQGVRRPRARDDRLGRAGRCRRRGGFRCRTAVQPLPVPQRRHRDQLLPGGGRGTVHRRSRSRHHGRSPRDRARGRGPRHRRCRWGDDEGGVGPPQVRGGGRRSRGEDRGGPGLPDPRPGPPSDRDRGRPRGAAAVPRRRQRTPAFARHDGDCEGRARRPCAARTGCRGGRRRARGRDLL